MTDNNPNPPQQGSGGQSRQPKPLETVLQDLEGVEKLQQMQSRLLRQVIQEVERLQSASP